MKKRILCLLAVAVLILATAAAAHGQQPENDEYIKWFSFDVPLAVLKQAYKYDINSQNTDAPLDFVQLLAYSAAANWGKFNSQNACPKMSAAVARIQAGERLHDIAAQLKLYNFYLEAYGAAVGGLVGEFEIETTDGEWQRKYGLKAFAPIAKNFGFSHSDDFGNPRSFGYRRPHLGNDMFGSIGTPIISVECGHVEALGWNPYGGWRVGIRSIDQKRYYYYAHLKKGTPFAENLEIGQRVYAGDVIGYLGNTGYSRKEDATNIKQPHLHFGIQIIFDESQKDGNNQIWIDAYNIVRFLGQNRMETTRTEGGHYKRSFKTNNFPFE